MARLTARHKIIDGKRFFKFKKFTSKGAADRRADKLKATGRYLIRVLPDGEMWAIFCFLLE